MKLAKSLLLASAAGFAAFGAQAADLPSKKAAPVEYVKVCSTYGAGFFTVPGTDGCLRVGGRVRADYVSGSAASAATEVGARASDMNVFRVRPYIFVDHRINSEVGLVRSFARLSFTRDNATTTATLFELGFVQVGGFTFGRFTNPYDVLYYTNGWAPLGLNGAGIKDSTSENGAAYTAALGNGLTATVGVFSSEETRAVGTGGDTVNNQSMPDVIGAVEWTQAWGSVKASGAIHQVRYTNAAIDTDYGFGVAGGVKINLPMLAAGDFIGLSGTYSQGAAIYGGVNALQGGQASFTAYDATTAGKLSTTWGLAGGLNHFWTKTVDTHVYGGYANFENGTAKANQTTVSQYTKWTPVAGLQFGVETTYRKMGGASVASTSDKADFSGRLRVQRDF